MQSSVIACSYNLKSYNLKPTSIYITLIGQKLDKNILK